MIPQEDGIVVSATEPIKNRRRIWLRKGKNLFNEKNSTNGWINSSGQTGESTATKRTGKIKIKANENYIFSYEYTSLVSQDNRSYCLYNSDFEVISNSGITYNPTLKQLNINSTVDGYVDIGYDVNCTDIMFEQASSKTSYEEYIDPEVFIKNTNGDYKEFIPKEEPIIKQYSFKGLTFSVIKYKRIVEISINGSTDQSLGVNTFYNLQLDDIFKPLQQVDDNITLSTTEAGMIRITTTGLFRIYPWTNLASGKGFRYTVTYISAN